MHIKTGYFVISKGFVPIAIGIRFHAAHRKIGC